MHVGGPVSLLFVIGAAHGAEISSQRVKPDVKNVRLFARNGNAPTNRRAGNAEITESAFDEAENLIAARFWLDEFRMLGVPMEQRLLKRGKLEEIICLGDSFRGASTVGTIFPSLYVHVSVVVDAVLPGIVAGVDESVFTAQFEEPLDGMRVLQIRSANEFVAGNAEFVPEGFPLGSHFRDEFGFRDARFFRGAFDIHTVFVGAGSHHHVITAHAFIAADGVADDGRIRVANVRQAVRVVDRRGQIELGLIGWHI